MILRHKAATVLLGAGLILGATIARAADYNIDPAHSSVGFSVRHIVSNVKGQFRDFSGSFTYDPKAPEKASVDATIQTKSINTNNEKRDGHLQSADFFDSAKLPTMTFKSTSVKSTAPGKLEITGNLTLHGVTKVVLLMAEGGEVAKDPWGGTRTGFSATTTIDRKDYGMNWNKALDNGGVLVGDEVKISLEIEGVQKK